MMKRLILALCISLTAVIYGFGASYDGMLTPRHTLERFYRIHPDSWIEDKAAILLPRLAPVGNRLTLALKAWRPPAVGPAHFRISVCGEQRAEFLVEKDSSFTFSLNGSCEPRRIDFQVVNPFVASEKDARPLGAQLQSAQISSRLTVPIVDVSLISLALLAVMILWLIYDRALSRYGLSWVGLAFAPLAWFFLSDVSSFNFVRIQALWVLAFSFGIGIFIAERYLRGGVRSAPVETPQDLGQGIAAVGISLIVLLGGALRFYGIDYGLPSNYHPDEVPKVNAIMRMVDQGDLNPTYFLHPSLLLYSTYALNKVFHLFGIDGGFRDTAFLAGRCVSALAGTASLYLIYRSGVLLFSRFVGLSAAALLAVFPLHVACSRYMKEDVLLIFYVLLTLVITLKAVYESRPRYLILAGFFAGVSASSKYSGLLSVLIPAAAPWLKSRRVLPDAQYLFYAFIGGLFAPLGFVLCTPYSVLTPEKFIKDFNSERHHMERGHTIPFDAWSQYWTYHYWRSIVPGTGLIAAALAVVAAGAFIFRWYFEGLFVIGLLLMFYMPAEWVKAKPAPQPERYILPCLPFMALAIAGFCNWLRGSRLKLLAPVLLIAAFIFPLVRSLQLASEVPVDTRDKMAQWMIEHLPAGSTVLMDWKPYCPRFWNNEFNVVYVPRATILTNLQMDNLKKSGGQYLVLSSLFYDRYFSQPNLDPGLRERFREVFGRVPIVHDIAPRYGTYGFNNPSLTLFSLKPEDFERLEGEIQAQKEGRLDKTSNEKLTSFPWAVVKRPE